MKNIFFIVASLIVGISYSQEEVAEKNFLKLKHILSTENNFIQLIVRLDSLKLTFKDKKNNYVDNLINRDIDFSYNHNRIRVVFDLYEYQIDLITKKDTIYLKSLKTEYINRFTYRYKNTNELTVYVNSRNQLYNSRKKIKDLTKEISSNVTYAITCGEELSYTDEALEIIKLVKKENIKSLKEMLASFSCEEQSYAVMGFSMLSQNKIDIPNEILSIIEHIKERNSELQICSGCIVGLIEKIY
jgi:hypothetical protein